jgi:hypothetical protein
LGLAGMALLLILLEHIQADIEPLQQCLGGFAGRMGGIELLARGYVSTAR